MTCYCFVQSILTIIPVIFIAATCTQYDLSIKLHEDLISPIDIKYTSKPLLALSLSILVLLLFTWAISFCARKRTCLRFTVISMLILLYTAWLIPSSVGIQYFTSISLDGSEISEKLLFSMKHYKENKNIKLSWDKMQVLFECCGTHNSTEWLTIIGGIPTSCHNNEPIQPLPNSRQACLTKFMEYIKHEIKSKCTAGLVLCILCIVLISCIPFTTIIIVYTSKSASIKPDTLNRFRPAHRHTTIYAQPSTGDYDYMDDIASPVHSYYEIREMDMYQ